MARKFSKIFFSFFILLMVFNFFSFDRGNDFGIFSGHINKAYAQETPETPTTPEGTEKMTIRQQLCKTLGAATFLGPLGIICVKENYKKVTSFFYDKFWDTLYGLMVLIIRIETLILGVFGLLLNTAIEFSINLSKYFGVLEEPINQVWGLIRDVFNVIFIFTLLYIAIGTILRLSKINAKEMLAQVIIAAILINFSMFITKAMIDVSNVISAQLYNTILTAEDGSGKTLKIADAFIQKTGISSVLTEEPKSDILNNIINAFSIIILVYFAIWIFVASTFIFLVRGALFIILMITSPVAIAGSIVPFTRSYSDQWWNIFNGQLLVAPIFLIFFRIALSVGGKTGSVFKGEGPLEDMSGLFRYGLILAILFIGLSASKKASGVIGEMFTKYAKMAVGVAAGLATGGAALAGSAVLGGAASRFASSGMAAKLKEKSLQGGISGKFASMALSVNSAAQKGTFDVRNTALGQYAQKKTGIDMSKGVNVLGMSVGANNKTSYQSRIDSEVTKQQERIQQAEDLVKDKANLWSRQLTQKQLEDKRTEDVDKMREKAQNKAQREADRMKARKDAAAAETSAAKKKALEDQLAIEEQELNERLEEENKKLEEEIQNIESDNSYDREREALKKGYVQGKVTLSGVTLTGPNQNLELQRKKTSFVNQIANAGPISLKGYTSSHSRERVARQLREKTRPKTS